MHQARCDCVGLNAASGETWTRLTCGCRTRLHSQQAGEPIATRWTPDIKAEVKRSRVATTRQLAAAINACPPEQRPKVLVNASAVGYYGSSEVRAVDCWWGWGMKVHRMCAMLEQLNTAWHVPTASAMLCSSGCCCAIAGACACDALVPRPRPGPLLEPASPGRSHPPRLPALARAASTCRARRSARAARPGVTTWQRSAASGRRPQR